MAARARGDRNRVGDHQEAVAAYTWSRWGLAGGRLHEQLVARPPAPPHWPAWAGPANSNTVCEHRDTESGAPPAETPHLDNSFSLTPR